MPGSSDTTDFQASTVSGMMSAGTFPQIVQFVINRRKCNRLYLLAERIYPKAPLSVHSIISRGSDEACV